MTQDADLYYRWLPKRHPAHFDHLSGRMQYFWQCCAVVALTLGLWYLNWRYQHSFNPDAPWFSGLMFGAELAMFLGTFLFFYDIWEERPRARARPSAARPKSARSVDVFLTTYDEAEGLVEDSLKAALAMRVPRGWTVQLSILDDGNRPALAALAQKHDVQYFARQSNLGFKAGNLRNALWHTDGAFVVVADADTRFFATFLENTLGYFQDPKVAWVQTPHWFCDVPQGRGLGERKGEGREPFWTKWMGWWKIGHDPFASASQIFFDIIQRRRDRHGASFCCGAASIHRREALFDVALKTRTGVNPDHRAPVQPFRFHVSEDILTSIDMHAHGWTSVYHPQVEARMLSPWSVEAWAAQNLKYSGGSIDIAVNRFWSRLLQIPWRIGLHYLATFWSYFAVIPFTFLLLAPVFALFTGIAPVNSYSVEFFLHLVPFLVALELALVLGMKGHDVHAARAANLMGLPFVLYAISLVVRRKKIGFKPTPKTLDGQNALRFLWPHLSLLAVFAAAAVYGIAAHIAGSRDHTLSMLVVNVFWLAWNGIALSRAVLLMRWSPQKALGYEMERAKACIA